MQAPFRLQTGLEPNKSHRSELCGDKREWCRRRDAKIGSGSIVSPEDGRMFRVVCAPTLNSRGAYGRTLLLVWWIPHCAAEQEQVWDQQRFIARVKIAHGLMVSALSQSGGWQRITRRTTFKQPKAGLEWKFDLHCPFLTQGAPLWAGTSVRLFSCVLPQPQLIPRSISGNIPTCKAAANIQIPQRCILFRFIFLLRERSAALFVRFFFLF